MYTRLSVLILTMALSSCFSSSGGKDQLRDDVSQDGISLGLQANLKNGSLTANTIASIYLDGERQALVGGDYFVARSGDEYGRLFSIENLSGDYQGSIDIADETAELIIETEYDPILAREDRWYPAEELLVDPGAREELIGYSQEFDLPERVTSLSINADSFSSRDDLVELTWDAGDGEQISLNAIVTCYDGSDEYAYSRFYIVPRNSELDSGDDGSYSVELGAIIQNEAGLNLLATLQREVSTIVAYVALEVVTLGLVSVDTLINAAETIDPFEMDSCDVNLTFFREMGEELPEDVAGGFAISSTSASLDFTYTPGAP